MEVMNSCGTLRRVEDPDAILRETRGKGCVMHAFSVAAEIDRQELGLLQTVVWQGPEDDLQATTEGHPWRDYTYAQTTTVHQTDDLDFVPILPGTNGGQP